MTDLTRLVADPAFQRALAGAGCLALGSAPLGVFLVLRRMSLMGDIIAHAILPGVAAVFVVAGMALDAMSLGGLAAGLTVALLAGLITRVTALREDASLAALYLIAVATGVLLIALHGTAQNLEDILFGDIAALNTTALRGMAACSLLTCAGLAVIYRPLLVESFDPVFLRTVSRRWGGAAHTGFMILTVITMVENYRTMGTLMAAALMLIPAIAAQFWTQRLKLMLVLSVSIGFVASAIGLVGASLAHLPPGPAITLAAGAIYVVSLLFGRFGSIRARYFPFRHLER